MRHFIGILLVAAVVAIPALASADPRAPGSIEAYDFGFNNPATGGSVVTINAGETVSFSYPEGNNAHNVVFDDGQPATCTPSLPDVPSPSGWTASCRFNTPGTYAFVCGAHAFMTGTVVVEAAAAGNAAQ